MSRGPDFICIGLQKAGTRWLYDQMASADGVWMPPIKELNYFNGNPFKALNLRALAKRDAALAQGEAESAANSSFYETFKRGMASPVDLDWYYELFAAKGSNLAGDVSPEYAKMEVDKIGLVTSACPGCKFVFLLRDPVSRFWSVACQNVRQGILAEQDLGDWRCVSQLIAKSVHQAQSFPTRIWRKWSTKLPPSALRFWFLEDIVARPEDVRQEIFDFVGGSKLQSPLSPSFNRKSNNKKYAMSDEIQHQLAVYFNAEIREAADLFGAHAVAWKKKNDAVLQAVQRGRPLTSIAHDGRLER